MQGLSAVVGRPNVPDARMGDSDSSDVSGTESETANSRQILRM